MRQRALPLWYHQRKRLNSPGSHVPWSVGHLVNIRAGYALTAKYFLEVALGVGRFFAWVLAEGHRWKEAIFVSSFICSTNIY